ncbi:dihydrolipoamide acetyltransferase family protein [Bacillus sp. FJAT-45350]|uniref:dihydrolipoamide acetyltransferase family protein n=1 Tax=Bacillus sp. FJAT-45350 TaxID=2011014 RepID=UPI000BB87A63|nr:dihydrolipoamide acetyltransferase family protein [Bacillus sp. FJAT-45350]
MVEVKLHDIGEGMTEGEIIHYFVKVGDTVKVDQPLVEVQTDKMVAELPSPSAGTIKEIIIPTGETVSVGTTLLIVEAEGSAAAPAPVAASEAPSEEKNKGPVTDTKKVEAPASRSGRVLAAPYTRKIARENGVDIEQVAGTGPAGRVTDEDVQRFINGEQAAPAQEVATEKTATTTAKPSVSAPTAPVTAGEVETIPFRGRRKQIAKKMTQSAFTIPHVTHFEEADLTNLLAFRSELKETGVNISVVSFFIKAIAIALKDFPVFNAKLDEVNEVIKLEKDYNIGLATDTEDGLVVPVLHNVNQKSLKQINDEMKELTKKAIAGELSGNEMKGGTFTISNVGPLGSIGATPIINHPETGIIAFHKTKKMPVVIENDEIAIRSMMTMSMGFDHRVADGATAVAFTNRFVDLIENPKKLLLELV